MKQTKLAVLPLTATVEKARLQLIPISEFSECVKKKHQNANIEFEEEFEVATYKAI